MKNRKLLSGLLILSLPLFALGSEKGSTKYTKISGQELHEMVMKMSDKEVGELLVKKHALLGGNCRVSENRVGLALFTLSMPGRALPMRFGIKEPVFSKLETTGHAPLSEGTYSLRTEDERNIALKELGSAFKGEISGRDWPCGTSELERGSISLADLRKEVKFYKDDSTGEIICISPSGKDSTIRKQNSCDYEPLLAELPPKLCRYLVHLARNDAEDQLQDITEGAKPSVSSFSRIPKFESIDNIRGRLYLARNIRENPSRYSFINQAQMPLADDFVDPKTLDLLASSELKEFSKLSTKDQLELIRMTVSIDAISGKDSYVRPSDELSKIVQAIKPHSDAFIKNNPGVQLDIYKFPTQESIVNLYSGMGVPNIVMNRELLKCYQPPRISLNTTVWTTMFQPSPELQKTMLGLMKSLNIQEVGDINLQLNKSVGK